MTTTIIIPYRDRQQHLDYFLQNTVKLFDDSFDFLIVEQAGDQPFNRGKLLNCGFELSTSDYCITHDVDVNPIGKACELYKENCSIWGIYTSFHNTLGGIVKISREHMYQINGFSNDYWGWGSEDKNFQNRANFFDIEIKKNILSNDPLKEKYFTIFDDHHIREKINIPEKHNFDYRLFPKLHDQAKKEAIFASGLNNLDFKILKIIDIIDRVQMITVSI